MAQNFPIVLKSGSDVCVCACVCVCKCACMYVRVCAHIFMHARSAHWTCIYICVYIHVYVRTHLEYAYVGDTCLHAHMLNSACVYIYICTCVNVCPGFKVRDWLENGQDVKVM